ncbi:RnfABCDGE type electron transport complex subunit G [Pseudomonas sp. H9]|uniref:RnfABCDGE type electron transport complex subunit G n=1 Tax=Pseudomonas sp. H9 TaxID=483968 RepID=UPI0010578DDB|nr:RnfABCDGE type electron transport complex subunit G [Pseudomonas sp. H9]TDF82771.1 RnfABCDGE type electron transport complex subunit G [Pseudomonas sp. H9]
MNRSTMRSGAVVLFIALLGVGSSMLWQHFSARDIALAEQTLKAQTWLSVLPATAYDNQPLQSPLVLTDAVLANSQLLTGYRATLAGRPSAVVLHSQAQGYAGQLELLIAIDRQGRLIGTKVLRQQETPGLGGKLVEPGNTWLQNFVGASRNTVAETGWALKRDGGQFDQLASATVTSRAVIHAVHDALRYFDEHRQALLGETGDE